jgi:radical SAM protein with 4Fe4S-binding SPASM domain
MRDFLSAPILIDFNITSRCNLSCSFCYASADSISSHNELSIKEIYDIIDELDNINVQRVSLVGGEPFIHPKIFDIISYCEKKDFSLIINTNGTLLNEEKIKQLQAYSLDGVMVSLDGREKVHNEIRGEGTYSTVIKSLKLLEKYDIPHASLFTLTSNNIHDLIPTLYHNQKLGIKNVGIMMLCPTGRAEVSHLIDPDLWDKVFLELTNIIYQKKIKINIKIIPINESEMFWEFFIPLESSNKLNLLEEVWKMELPKVLNREIACSAGINTAAIDPEGNIFGCDLMISYPELSAGNIRNDTFRNIWEKSKILNDFRRLSIQDLEEPCKTCEYVWCGGGCRASAYALSGKNLFASDKNCHVARGYLK